MNYTMRGIGTTLGNILLPSNVAISLGSTRYASSCCSKLTTKVPLIAGIDPTKQKPPYSYDRIIHSEILRRLGPSHIEAFKAYINTIVLFGTALAITLIYFTNWKVIVTHIPFYGSQFKTEEEN
ncbi:uncharacterized protein LOC108742157 [Agrilus planipennis]|uniref:Uncharacterized protein LOC108742157 n=1 Tax=Agrilus planipennis TaxID=224129 RepID=A0A1W4XK11_AGRPL|nr:uncharacterized protein LOC108742157 [Agrilus planipennis]